MCDYEIQTMIVCICNIFRIKSKFNESKNDTNSTFSKVTVFGIAIIIVDALGLMMLLVTVIGA